MGIAQTELGRSIDKELPKRTEEQRVLRTSEIEQRCSERLDTIHAFLTENGGAKLYEKLDKASLKDLAIVEGIAYDKLLLLRGQPNVLFGSAEHQKLDALLPALLAEMQRRGTTVELTERKATVSLEEPSLPPAS